MILCRVLNGLDHSCWKQIRNNSRTNWIFITHWLILLVLRERVRIVLRHRIVLRLIESKAETLVLLIWVHKIGIVCVKTSILIGHEALCVCRLVILWLVETLERLGSWLWLVIIWSAPILEHGRYGILRWRIVWEIKHKNIVISLHYLLILK